MNLTRLINNLRKFKNIVVSGPQRSGTRITSKIIAEELGKLYVDEQDIHVDSIKEAKQYLRQGDVVLQCPGLSHVLIQLSSETTAIVMCVRPLNEIYISQDRINWPYENYEKSKFGYCNESSSWIKYECWKNNKDRIDNPFDINYEDLKVHKKFIDKSKRMNFSYCQTEEKI